MAGSRPSKNPPVTPPATDVLSVDCSKWVFAGVVAENQQLTQVVEQQQGELVEKTQAHAELVKKTRLLENKLDEEVERARLAKRKLETAEAKLVEKDKIAQVLRTDLDISQAATVASNQAHDKATSEASALRQQLDETKAELASAQKALDESKATARNELDATRAELTDLRKALEKSRAETSAKQAQLLKLSQVNDRQSTDRQVLAREYARLKVSFDTFGQLCMPGIGEAGEEASNTIIHQATNSTGHAAKSFEAIDRLTTGNTVGRSSEAGPSSPPALRDFATPGKRRHDDDNEDDNEDQVIVLSPGVDVRIRGGILRPATRKAKKARADSTTDEEINKTVGANVSLVPSPTTPAGNGPPTFASSRNSARTRRRPHSVDKDPLTEISTHSNIDEEDKKPDIVAKTLPPYDPDDLDDLCLMPTPDSYGVGKIPPEWSSPSVRRTPHRTSANSKRLKDIPSSGSAKKRTLRTGSVVGNTRAGLQVDDDDDHDPINL